MPHDRYGRKIAIGDVIKTAPYNTHDKRKRIGVVQELKEEQSCSGIMAYFAPGEVKKDYFGAGESELVLKADGSDPEPATTESDPR